VKILLVEDDLDLIDVTAYSLRRERFAVIEATDGAQALHRWKVDRPDLIVLDLGLPRHDGFEVLQRVREKDTTPIVVLSGRRNEQDVFRAFTLGADDFVAKPFAAKHLALRIRAILRRSSAEPVDQSEPTLVLGDIRVDPEVQEVQWGDSYIRLTPTEFRIFHILAMHVGRIVTTRSTGPASGASSFSPSPPPCRGGRTRAAPPHRARAPRTARSARPARAR